MANNKDARRGGFYWLDGKPLLSVTEILKVIDKPALRYWFGQEVFYAMMKNPSLNEKEALAAPYQTSKEAMNTGQLVHSIIESYKTTGKVIETIPEDYKKYAQAFYNFMDEVKPEIIEQEKTITDPETGIAGTLDMYAKIGDVYYVLDFKTGKDIYTEVDLQMSAYAHMLRAEGKPVDKIGAVLLEKGEDKLPTGNYKFANRTEVWEAFLHTKALYEFINREKLLKAGYLE